jgi:hypothetical protein
MPDVDPNTFANMTPEDFAAWKAGLVGEPAKQTSAPADPYDLGGTSTEAPNEWDFNTPSGKLCRLRKPTPLQLLQAGILDKVTRLQGLSAGLVDEAEGVPPGKEAEVLSSLPALLEVLDALVPIVVVKPTILPLPPENQMRNPQSRYVDSVDFFDKVAIMEQALQGVKALDSFRNA